MSEIGRQISELRRSNASGLHDHKPSRSQLRRYAIEESGDCMSILDKEVNEDYLPDPSEEDLIAIEQEELDADLFLYSIDEDDYRDF